jgi:inner membrane transporter RhtA
MARNLSPQHLPTAPVPAPTESTGRQRAAGVALMLTAATSTQFGASFGALAFPAIGPVGVVAVRQWVAAIVLGAVARPKFWRFRASQWRPILVLAFTFMLMNLCVYVAIDRIGLGLTITLEFLGPLAIALFGSKRLRTVLCGIAAGVAAVCWAVYIFANRAVGQRLPGVEGSATAAGISALAYLPVGVIVLVNSELTLQIVVYALLAGVLSSGVPYFVDVIALRLVPAHFFGVFMSVQPIIAALVGMLMLGERLDLTSWIAMLVIVAANAVAVTTPQRRTVTKRATARPRRAREKSAPRE